MENQRPYDVVILGGGESGCGAAALARSQGLRALLSDAGRLKEEHRAELRALGVDYEEGGHSYGRMRGARLFIKSPGIPDDAPAALFARDEAARSGGEVIGEIEYGARHSRARFVAVTGSNGKTTTTLLIHHMMQAGGLDAGLAGNVGRSLARQVAEGDRDWYVVELSSFQLDTMSRFRAHVAVLTNITPDHLDRYGHCFDNYARSKMRVTMNQTPADYLVYWPGDPVASRLLAQAPPASRLAPFGMAARLPDGLPQAPGALADDRQVRLALPAGPAGDTQTLTLEREEMSLKGTHNTLNAMAAGLAAGLAGIKKESIRTSLADFKGVEHRLEEYLSVRGALYINDSKATNVNSTWYAIESMTRPTVWIAGGVDKGNDYSELDEVARRNVKALICLGTDNAKLVAHFGPLLPVVREARSMREAVALAYQLAQPDDAVLLSPACASFDLFQNYEDRGRQFKQAVRDL